MSQPEKASLGVALIAKNAGKTLGPCLIRLRDHLHPDQALPPGPPEDASDAVPDFPLAPTPSREAP